MPEYELVIYENNRPVEYIDPIESIEYKEGYWEVFNGLSTYEFVLAPEAHFVVREIGR